MGTLVIFDPTITIGALAILAGQIITMFWFAARMDKRIDLLANNLKNQGDRTDAAIDHLSKRIDAQADAVKEYARIGERFATLEGRVTNHGSMLTLNNRSIADLQTGRRHRVHLDAEFPEDEE